MKKNKSTGSKRRKKKRKTRREDPQVLGYPLSLIKKQPAVNIGDEFKCPRCGNNHRMADGKHEIPETQVGDVLIYRCGERTLVGGIKGHSVVELENKLARHHRMASCLLDFVNVFTPLAVAVTQQERKINRDGILLVGSEYIPMQIPLSVAKKVRYAIKMANETLKELDFVKIDEQVEKIMFDPETTSLVNPHEQLLPLMRPNLPPDLKN
jgi:hypothetical protein